MGLRPTKGHEDDAGKSVGRRKRLPHVGPSGAGASACQPASSTESVLFTSPNPTSVLRRLTQSPAKKPLISYSSVQRILPASDIYQ